MRHVLAILVLGSLWAACSAPLRLIRSMAGTPTMPPTFTAEPTFPPTPRPTSTVRPAPSPRPLPTIDPALTLFPTLSFTFPTPSSTATAAHPLDCRLDWQSPGNGLQVNPDQLFTVGWHVTNTGTDTWSPGSVSFTYLGGTKPNRDTVIGLKFSVAPGQSVTLTAEMKAPRNSTLYTTYWGLRQGDTFFCRVSVSIYVK